MTQPDKIRILDQTGDIVLTKSKYKIPGMGLSSLEHMF